MYIRYSKSQYKVLNVSTDSEYVNQEETSKYAFATPANSPDGFDLSVDKYYEVGTDTIRNATQSEIDQWALEDAKIAKISEIDIRTQELIGAGFTFDSNVFSLSLEAQSNWHVLWNGRTDIVTYPKEVSTIESDAYSIPNATTMDNFGMTAFGTVSEHIQSGRDLKVQVRAATSVSEVDAVVDNR